METGIWKSPVVIEMYGRPGTVFITGTLDAALMLIGAWPTKRTDAHIAAVLSCRDVLTGRADARLARINFIEAAMEAGYRIEPETFLSDRWDLTPRAEDPTRPAVGLADLIRKRAVATVAETAIELAPQTIIVASPDVTEEPMSLPVRAPQPRLRELFAGLLRQLGLIGAELGRSLVSPFSFTMPRRTDRQVQ